MMIAVVKKTLIAWFESMYPSKFEIGSDSESFDTK